MSNHLAEGAGSFPELIRSMEELGFFTGLLPFVITYTIFFFMLRKVGEEIFDADDNNRADMFAAILSIAFAFFTSKFILANPMFMDFFTNYIGRFTVIAVGLLGLLVILGFVGIDLEKRNSVGYILAILVVAAFAVSGGVSSFLPAATRGDILSQFTAALAWTIDTGIIFVFLIIGLLFWTMGDSNDNDNENPWYHIFNGAAESSDGES